jgi:protein TonB
MPRDLFGHVTRPSISVGNRKWYTVPVSLLSHSAIVLVMVLVPLLAPAWMPDPFEGRIGAAYIDLIPPTPPLPPNNPRPIDKQDVPTDPGISLVAPDGISAEPPRPEAGWETPLPAGTVVGTFESNVVPPPVAVTVAPSAPVRAGGTSGVRVPQKLNEVNPAYPPIAMQAHIEGIVIIEATINESGNVVNARVLRSVPLLDQAAVEAVKQWRYTPSMLNGSPVPVIMTVTVNFTLK